MRIIRNAARCRKCKEVIESRHRHDFVMCRCESIHVDGGKAYLKGGGDFSLFEDLSEVEHDDVQNV